jgi:hypothetical protein
MVSIVLADWQAKLHHTSCTNHPEQRLGFIT